VSQQFAYSSKSPELAVLILAGGKSARMGTDKALIRWQGKTILERVAIAANQCSKHVYILTPRVEQYRRAIETRIGDRNGSNQHQPISEHEYKWLSESQPSKGPVWAMVQGMAEIQKRHISNHPIEWVLVLACDLPLLNPQILQTWIAHLHEIAPACLAYVPRLSQRWEPLCGFYRLAARESLLGFLSNGGKSFQAWLNGISVLEIELTAEAIAMLHNCNTPEDLNRM
jgi:molybdopterin-guanine dinucleotide biosynthesis protein A